MWIYDGSADIKAKPTKHTVAVTSANRIVCAEKDQMTIRKNGREDWSLYCCETGAIYFDNQVVCPGEIWIYPPRVFQKYVIYSKDQTAYRYLHFTGSALDELLSALGIATCVPIETGNRKAILKSLDCVQLAMGEESPVSRLSAECYVLSLLIQIARKEKFVPQPGVMKRVLDDMEHCFAEKYDALRYAKMLGLSVSRFNHLFKEQIGMSPYAFLVRLRIDNAAAMLEHTDKKIGVIAAQCGFEDPLYFTQAFKRIRGMTPSQYRSLKIT